MNWNLRSLGPGVSIVLVGAALSAGLGVHANSAQAQAANPGSEQQLTQLRQQVAALEQRVIALEKTRGGGVVTQNDTAPKGADTKQSAPTATEIPQLIVRAPFIVLDAYNRPIMTVQDAAASVVKDVKTGRTTEVATSNRGVHVFNPRGDAVARLGVAEGAGYVSARAGGQGVGLGGLQGVLYADNLGSQLGLTGADQKRKVFLTSQDQGLIFESTSGQILTELNRTHLWIGNAAGQGLVEAGEQPDGRGRVTVGPRFGGPQGGGAITFPYMIVGRK